MAALNFPDPNTTQTYTEAGITWTWNATLGVWSTDANDGFTEDIADDLYLSKVNDDTAAGEITFEKQSTHEGGVTITGGQQVSLQVNPIVSSVDSEVTGVRTRPDFGAATAGTFTSYTGFNANSFSNGFADALTEIKGYTMGNLQNLAGNTAGDVVYGYYAPLTKVTAKPNLKVYNFYAEGTAPNYFAGSTEHAGGLSVTGGESDPDVTSTTYPWIWSGNEGYALYLRNRGLSPEAPGVLFNLRKPDDAGGGCHILNDNNTDGTQKAALFIAGAWAGDYTGTGGSSIYKNAYLRVTANIQSSTTDASNPVLGVQSGSRVGPGNHWRCFHASRPTVGDVATEYIGYYTGINNDAANTTYAFYGSGNAPSYFGGAVKIVLDSDNTAASSSSLNRNTANGGDASSTNSKIIWFNSGGAKKAKIEFDGAGGVNYATSHSDYRAKENVVDLPSAVDKIKALRPVNFNFLWSPGKTRAGFIAHELKEVVPLCVSGEKDAVTRLGTMTFPDGTTKANVEDISDEGAVPFGTTWEETHTEPDYQSVSHDHLIPILTKALQEALERIETLESLIAS